MTNMVWVDLETTGLEPVTNEILEFGCVITDERLNVMESYKRIFNPVAGFDDFSAFIEKLDPVVREMHTNNGLFDEILSDKFTTSISSDIQFVEDLTQLFEEFGVLREPMRGSTIQFDRAFLRYHCPTVEGLFHYRNVDVSTIKCCYKEWKVLANNLDLPDWEGSDPKPHRAIEDCLESIKEFGFYREHLFV